MTTSQMPRAVAIVTHDNIPNAKAQTTSPKLVCPNLCHDADELMIKNLQQFSQFRISVDVNSPGYLRTNASNAVRVFYSY